MTGAIVGNLQTLADATRNRLLLLLEKHELTVSELCSALQVPQSTVSRHLKVLADDGWITPRSEGPSRLYRLSSDLDAAARRLWQVVREEVTATPAASRDADRLRAVLAERRKDSEKFFATAAGQWDTMRAELFGARTELLPFISLLEPAWCVADLGCGTGHLSQAIAPFVREVIAVDASAAMLRSAKARLEGVANVDVRRGQLEALPLGDGSVDVACLVLVLPYVAEPAQVIAEAARILKPGGRLLVTDLMPHERAEYRQTMGHLRQGVAEEDFREWMDDSGMTAMRYAALPIPGNARGPRLFSAGAIKPHREQT